MPIHMSKNRYCSLWTNFGKDVRDLPPVNTGKSLVSLVTDRGILVKDGDRAQVGNASKSEYD